LQEVFYDPVDERVEVLDEEVARLSRDLGNHRDDVEEMVGQCIQQVDDLRKRIEAILAKIPASYEEVETAMSEMGAASKGLRLLLETPGGEPRLKKIEGRIQATKSNLQDALESFEASHKEVQQAQTVALQKSSEELTSQYFTRIAAVEKHVDQQVSQVHSLLERMARRQKYLLVGVTVGFLALVLIAGVAAL